MKVIEVRGLTILFSTHIISDLEKCADDIIYIQEGRIHSALSLQEFAAAYPQDSLEEIGNMTVRSVSVLVEENDQGYYTVNSEDLARLDGLVVDYTNAGASAEGD